MPPKQLPLPTLPFLKPFRSFLFLKLTSPGNAAIRTNELRDVIADLARDLRGATLPVRSARSTRGELYSAYAAYRRERRAAWTTHPEFVDVEHHLLLVSGYRHLFAVFASDASLREAIKTELAEEAQSFEDFERISTNRLNAVFVRGRARTLWLNNIQGRTSLKADNKVLSGINLEDALDPLGDQSYAFSAARCQNDVAETNSTYGIAPSRSRLWFKPSKNWDEYTTTVMTLLQALNDSTSEEAAPLPVLSVPITGPFDIQHLGEAYDLAILPSEVTNPADDAEVDLAIIEATPELTFEVVNGALSTLIVEVFSDVGQTMGQYRFGLALDTAANVSWSIDPLASGTAETAALLNRLTDRINASFDGGFSVSARRIHSAQYRDLPFGGFTWTTFAQTNIRKEKPNPLAENTIGTQDSLFCWIRTQWPLGTLNWLPAGGWLASNDGALEVADFIHLSEGDSPMLTLVHVKAAANDTVNRPLAVSPYEIVVSQAVKNLRHLDPVLAASEFMNRLGHQIQSAVWHDGLPAARQDMLAAMQLHGTSLTRRVVILQPHSRKEAFDAALNAAPNSRARHVVRQLNTLLLGAQQGCAALGANLVVVAHDA
jgi:hypothetical protein